MTSPLPRLLQVVLPLCALIVASQPAAQANDGYKLWLEARPCTAPGSAASPLAKSLEEIQLVSLSGKESATTKAAREELGKRLALQLGIKSHITLAASPTGKVEALEHEGFRISRKGGKGITLAANTDIGLLYGAFALVRSVQTGCSVEQLERTEVPRLPRRILNHWDNLNRFVERGYAGQSLWDWFLLPDVVSPRMTDYARACASIGINGTVLTNVNADALVLSPEYLAKVAALADAFRPWGVRVYLTARFSAPMELGGLTTADPLDPAVAAWWKSKVDEIYRTIPDFGGFLVKANSEGQPGPQNYGRNHADGANMMADALAPHGGLVLWRAFVYEPHPGVDRLKQAHLEFAPLDGKFRDNVIVQIKNGPLDFMPREPFHPLFGAMPRTPLALELQITQEYLGGSTQLAFLAPLWKECLDSDTFTPAAGASVASVVAGQSGGRRAGAIAGVANIGTERNWTGHPLAQANWYAFGRLAWNPALSSEDIAREWTRLTFGGEKAVEQVLVPMLLGSRETVVRYSMPLGLHHIMAEGHHYGPGPWVVAARPDWSSTYYHKADKDGIGADRTASGSDALEQYAPALRTLWGKTETCPEDLLLWFHHVSWDHRMKSGRTLWDELCLTYQRGVAEVRAMRGQWASLAAHIDPERFALVSALLARQEKDAVEWRDACLAYFGSLSGRPLPAGVEPPAYPLEHYMATRRRHMPGNP